ncbi:MAG: GldG family protein [Planctomycetes bacterium]|nr:GldG family protein [Planctomycetota bacterium]
MVTQPRSHPRYGLNALVAFAAAVGILILMNFLGTRHFWRLDVTEEKSQTLSPKTHEILRGLQDLCTLKTYISRDLPPEMLPSRARIEDLLREYEAYGGAHLLLEEVDPGSTDEEKQKTQSLGIQPLQFFVRRNDKQEAATFFAGLTVSYGGKTETIPVIQAIAPGANAIDLEYDLTQAILKVTTRTPKKIIFLKGHNEREMYSQEMKPLREELEKMYDLSDLNPNDGKPIPEDTAAVIVAGPKDIDDVSEYALDQYLVKGGSLLLCLEAIDTSNERMPPSPQTTGLEDWCQSQGVRLLSGLLRDEESPKSVPLGPFMAEYPYWPLARRDHWDRDHFILQRLQSVTFPWVTGIELLEGKFACPPRALIKSTEHTWERHEPFNDLQPLKPIRVDKNDFRQFTLAATASGKFHSFYADKSPPIPKPPEGPDAKPPDPLPPPVKDGEKEGRLVVVGDADFLLADTMLGWPEQGRPNNTPFVLNLVDWLARNEEAAGIRPRDITARPLKIEDDETLFGLQATTVYKVGGIAGMPLLVALLGLVRWLWRRSQTNRFLTRLAIAKAAAAP